MGISCHIATCLIRWARRLHPLATTTGAAISGRYSRATAKWVGLVMTTVARSTSFNMRRRRICRCSRRRRAFDRGIAVGLLVFVAQLLLAHAQVARQFLALQQVVDARPQQQHQRRLPADLQRPLIGELADFPPASGPPLTTNPSRGSECRYPDRAAPRTGISDLATGAKPARENI